VASKPARGRTASIRVRRIAGPSGRTGVLVVGSLFLEVSGILEERFHLIEQLLLFEDVEGGYLFQFHIEGTAEDGFRVIVLDQRAGLGVAGGEVDGLFKLVYPEGLGQRVGSEYRRPGNAYSFLRLL
jgi:hypothetical protein